MKKLILIALIALSFKVSAQTSDTTKYVAKEQYCMVMATSKFLSTKVTITVDFGQETHLFKFVDTRVKDEAGKVVAFNSTIDALNYMASRGWVFVNAYVITTSGQNVYHYVMKRDL
jgi:hypothetical protein